MHADAIDKIWEYFQNVLTNIFSQIKLLGSKQ